jgi:hypothetical protein
MAKVTPVKVDPKLLGRDKTTNLIAPKLPAHLQVNKPKHVPLDENSQAYLRVMLEQNIEAARTDANTLIEFVMVDPKQRPLVQARMHEEWQELFKTSKYLNLWSFVEAGKSAQLTGYLLSRLGQDPDLRIIYVSKNETAPKKVAAELQRYIQSQDEVGKRLRLVYPNLRPGTAKQDQWSALNFNIHRTNPYMKDPTFQGFGLGSNPTSSRVDIAILDDLLTVDSTAKPSERDKTWDFIQNKVLSRLTGNAQVIVAGTPYHHDDVLHRLELQRDTWVTAKYPVIDRFTWDESSLAWPEVWSMKRVLEKKGIMSASDFAKQMLCEARDDSSSLFLEADIRDALAKGFAYDTVHSVSPLQLGSGWFIYTGVDFGIKKGLGRDFTSLFTVLVSPNGQRQVLWVETGQWGPRDIAAQINDTYDRYRGVIYLENNAAQDWMVQWMADEPSRAAIRPFTTGNNKHHPEYGVESISMELSKGMWTIPCKYDPDENPNKLVSGHAHIDRWIQDMLYYRRGAHTGDSLIASWICREGIRYGEYNQSASLSASLLGKGSSRIIEAPVPSMFSRYTING